jgi:CRISPR-associated exonuclease Cas4
MKEEYEEEDYLLLSGIQHFAFCPRQWALIHIENIWKENFLTTSGEILHNKAHDGESFEKRGNLIVFRALRIASRKLGVSGECDIVEFHKDKKGIKIKEYDDLWIPYPVEYKRGKSKLNDCDRMQLCAQTICLEEMFCCEIKEGALYYGEPRKREIVEISEELRQRVEIAIKQMHSLYSQNHTPKSKTGRYCLSCSLRDECLPKMLKKDNNVQKYLEDNIE